MHAAKLHVGKKPLGEAPAVKRRVDELSCSEQHDVHGKCTPLWFVAVIISPVFVCTTDGCYFNLPKIDVAALAYLNMMSPFRLVAVLTHPKKM